MKGERRVAGNDFSGIFSGVGKFVFLRPRTHTHGRACALGGHRSGAAADKMRDETRGPERKRAFNVYFESRLPHAHRLK